MIDRNYTSVREIIDSGVKLTYDDRHWNKYSRQYIVCWIRSANGFVKNRRQNIAVITSDQWMNANSRGSLQSMGILAQCDDCWK